MAKKFGMFEDIGEQLLELGKSTAKKTVKAVVQTVNPLSALDSQNSNSLANPNSLKNPKSPKSTPLDLDKLQNKYQDQDKMKTQALRQRLFQMVKSGDEKLLMEKKQEEMQKKRQEAYQEQEKKRREQEQKNKQGDVAPQGKVRRSIFSHKKVAKREQTEVKPASGKQ
jgi:hypothetical protein